MEETAKLKGQKLFVEIFFFLERSGMEYYKATLLHDTRQFMLTRNNNKKFRNE